ncbi:hypothetical protein SAY87_017242 [Trapa incisa]|uniref:Protein kinase domain-containing protein n=1 Tax=Trapa incisa TaxID=236973 RepID=A0AAN7L872_9MYRT|nr:hypothetical protein SAY87_017242 [Trapa incisa]
MTTMYLHEVCSPSIIHKNIKSANILLDLELNPYLSDSGLASFFPNAEQALSQNAGLGYSAPEGEPEFRPPMSEVVQALVRVVQRTNMSKRTFGKERVYKFLITDSTFIEDPSRGSTSVCDEYLLPSRGSKLHCRQ